MNNIAKNVEKIEYAKKLIINSKISKFVSLEKIEKSFKRIHLYNNIDEFMKEYGKKYDGKLEGFNRSNGSHISPESTIHTIIHEILHELSSKFDENNHRIENGIQGKEEYNFSDQVNEGLTDYLAGKISGEAPRHYLIGNYFFKGLDKCISKYYDEDILLEIYLNKDDKKIKQFLDKFGGNGASKKIYNEFLFLDKEKIDIILKRIERNVNIEILKQNIKNKFKMSLRVNESKSHNNKKTEKSQIEKNHECER